MNNDAPDGADEIRDRLPQLAAATGAPAPGDGRSVPSIAINQPFAALCRAVGQCLRNAPLFRKGESLVTVNASTGEELPITASVWRSWHQQFFTFHEGDGDKRRTVNCSKDNAQVILDSHELRAHVRELRAVNLLRLPVWRGAGAVRALDLLPDGYDAATKTFTVPVLDYPLDWTIEQALAFLGATFGTFPFFESGELFSRRSFSAFIAGMLGVYAVNLLPDDAVRPMLVVNGNQPGLGKTLLVHAMLAPVHGRVADDAKPKSDEELRNVLDAVALAAAPYLVLDDAANLHSHDLNRFITSPVHEPRVKGFSRRVRCPNVTQVFATGNGLNLTEDLDRRALVVDLFDPCKAAERAVLDPLTNTFIFSNTYRAAACAAQWAIFRHWRDAGFPQSPEARKPTFEHYAALTGSALVCAGTANPHGPRECQSGGDDAGRALETAVCRCAGAVDKGSELTTDDILDRLREDGTLDVAVPFAKSDLGQRQSLGHKLRKLCGRIFTDARGRRFEFGQRTAAAGSRYTLHFLDADASA